MSRVLAILVLLLYCGDVATAQVQADRWELVDSVLVDDEFGQSAISLTDIACPDPQHCFVAGFTGNVLTLIRSTSDRGRTWQTCWSDSTIVRGVGDIRWARRLNGLAADRLGLVLAALDSGVILRSTDFGQSWTEMRLPRRAIVRDAAIVSDMEALVLQDTMIWHSTDRGESWTKVEFVHPLHSLGYRSGTIAARSRSYWTILLGKRAGSVYATTADAGATWSDVGPLAGRPVSRVVLGESGRGWSIGGDTTRRHDVVARTRDSGATWQIVLDTVPEARWAHGLMALAVWRDRLILAGGFDGAVWRSFDGGTTWVAMSEGIATDDPGENITGIALLDSVTYAAVSTSGAVRLYRSSILPSVAITDSDTDASSSGPIITSDGGWVFINAREKVVPDIEVFDAIGRRALTAQPHHLEDGRVTITLRDLPAGPYIVRVTGPFGVECALVVRKTN